MSSQLALDFTASMLPTHGTDFLLKVILFMETNFYSITEVMRIFGKWLLGNRGIGVTTMIGEFDFLFCLFIYYNNCLVNVGFGCHINLHFPIFQFLLCHSSEQYLYINIMVFVLHYWIPSHALVIGTIICYYLVLEISN